jgi:hypothetical protein
MHDDDTWRPTWDLTTIPAAEFADEADRRRAGFTFRPGPFSSGRSRLIVARKKEKLHGLTWNCFYLECGHVVRIKSAFSVLDRGTRKRCPSC